MLNISYRLEAAALQPADVVSAGIRHGEFAVTYWQSAMGARRPLEIGSGQFHLARYWVDDHPQTNLPQQASSLCDDLGLLLHHLWHTKRKALVHEGSELSGVLYVASVYVHPGYRGHGLGRLAVQRLIDDFTALNWFVGLRPWPMEHRANCSSRKAAKQLAKYWGDMGFLPLPQAPRFAYLLTDTVRAIMPDIRLEDLHAEP